MSFIFGGDTGQSQSDITDARKRLAMAMLQKGTDTSPISSPWQGAARLAESLMGGLAIRKQADQQKEADAQVMAAITGTPYTPPAQSPGLFGSLFGGGKKSVPASGAQSEIAASSPSSQSTAAAIPGDPNQIQTQFLDTVKNGYDVAGQKLAVTNPYGLAAIAATGQAESGWSPQNAGGTWADGKNPAGGILSWNGPRLANLQKFAGGTNGTPEQQGQFFLQENPGLINALNNAKSVAEAQHLMNNAWAFKGYDQPGNANAAHRLALANGFLPRFAQGGAPSPQAASVAAAAPLAPVSAPTPIAPPQAGPTQVASLDPSAGMSGPTAAGSVVPPPSPTAGPDDFSKVSPDQMQALLGPQATPGYHDPRVTTAFQQAPAPSPAAQAIQQQAPLPDPQQTAAIDPGGSATPAPQPAVAPQQPTVAANAPPAARLANALQSAPPAPPNPLMGNPKAKALAAALMNPNASPQVRQMAGVMLQQEMSQGQALYKVQMEQYLKQQDPEYQLNLKKAQYEVEHLGEVSPDTRATLAAQDQKMKFDADQAIRLADHNQQLKQNDPLEQANVAKATVETANLVNPRMSPAEQAAADLAKQKETFEEGKGVTVPAGQSLVAPGGPNAGKVIFQGTGFAPNDVHEVRKEFEGLPNYKSYQQAAPVYQSMIDTAKTDSKASDLNLVYGLGKIMDPNSVVREGEMVMVNNTSSLPDWVQGAINAVNGGSRLEPATRTAILNEARSRMGAYRGALDNDIGQYTGIAQRRGMNPQDIIPTLSPIADVPSLTAPNATGPVTGITNDWQQVAPGVRIRKVN